ncbi:BolA-like family protein [Actinidia rufa]|uniref:BolA-like family protein n=1 Tax=Actinidia rufa TaxID=165716 RepID=A0A7J0EBU5_9ERIC|nr:BolA-like family protein [Actinidia rufa]
MPFRSGMGLSAVTMPCKFPSALCHTLGFPSTFVSCPSFDATTNRDYFIVLVRAFAPQFSSDDLPIWTDGDPLTVSLCLLMIKEHLNADSVLVKDAYGDGRHVSIDVISSAFEGQSVVSRQRMVYKAIWEELQNTVHAVDQMTTRTPAEIASAK